MLIFLSLLIPILAVGLIISIGEKNNYLRNSVIMIACLIDFGIVLWIAQLVWSGNFPVFTLVETPTFSFQFRVDHFGVFMGILVTFLWILTELYSFGYMTGEHKQTRYFACLTFCLTATLGIVFAANLLTLFIFYELLTYAVYPLVIHEESEEALRSGTAYLVYLLTGGIMLLFATLWTYKLTGGDISFTPGGIPLLRGQSKYALYGLFLLLILGFGFKSALMPLHSWLPRAMIAPTPISALLHAVAVVKVGLYGIIRAIYCIFGPDLFKELYLNYLLAGLASITIILGAITALRQSKIKRMLAYSTINQLSFVILGAASCHPIGLLGALLHFIYHSVMKITLFYTAGSIIKQTGKTLIKEMVGLAGKMPLTSAAFAIAAWGIVGLPPVAGWVSKWYLLRGFFALGQYIFIFVIIIGSVIEIGFLLPPIVYAYFKTDTQIPADVVATPMIHRGKQSPLKEPSLSMLVPILIVALLSLIFGVIGGLPLKLAQEVVSEFFR